MTTKYGGQTLWFSWHGGYVKKSKCKESSLMTMFGSKWTKEYGQKIILFHYYYLKNFFKIVCKLCRHINSRSCKVNIVWIVVLIEMFQIHTF